MRTLPTLRAVLLSLLALTTAIPAVAQAVTPRAAGWTAVYRHDENGAAVTGSMAELKDAIRRGYNIRIGWGWIRERNGRTYSLEHTADPIFVTIFQEDHVSAVIEPHPLLDNYLDPEKQTFVDPGQIWQCVLVTTGAFNAKIFRRATGELIRDFPQRMSMTWFVEYPAEGAPTGRVKPFYAKPDGG